MLRIQKEKKFFYSIYEHTLKFNHVFVLLMVPISYTDIFVVSEGKPTLFWIFL